MSLNNNRERWTRGNLHRQTTNICPEFGHIQTPGTPIGERLFKIQRDIYFQSRRARSQARFLAERVIDEPSFCLRKPKIHARGHF